MLKDIVTYAHLVMAARQGERLTWGVDSISWKSSAASTMGTGSGEGPGFPESVRNQLCPT